MSKLPRPGRLKKELTLFDVYAISTGAMFSSGFFLLPGLAAAQAGPAVILAYLIAGVLILPAMFSKAELSTAMPRAGGTYYFLDRSMGPLVGTVGGLGTYLALTLKSAFALVGMGAYLAFFVHVPVKPLAVACTVVFMALNIVGAKETTSLQRLLVIVLLGVLAFFTVQGLAEVAGLGLGTIGQTQLTPFMPFGVEGLLATVGFVFVSYAGLTKVASVAEEVRNPDRNIPLGMGLSLLTATVIYVIGVFIMVSVLDAEALRHDLTPVATAGEAFFDWLPKPIGLVLIVAAAIAAFASTGNAGLMSASRYPLAMARDRLLPDGLARLGRFQTPVPAVVLTAVLMIACILVLSEEGIAKLASAFQLFIFMLVNFAVIVMRESRISSYDPGFRSPLYPWMQVLGILAPVVLIYMMGWMAMLFTLGMAGVCLGWYFYYARGRVVRDGAIYHWFERLGRRRYEGLDAELRTILKEKGLRAEDPFDEVVARAAVVDLQRPSTFEAVVQPVAQHLERRLMRPSAEIAQEFMQGTRVGATPVARGIALPHIQDPTIDRPELVLVRSEAGIHIPLGEEDDDAAGDGRTAHALFFLVSPEDNPGQHLRILAQIAGRADDDGFQEAWLGAGDEQQLKEVLLRDEHFLALTVEHEGRTAGLAARALRDVRWPEDCLVALIRRRDETIVPSGNTVLEPGDRLTILGSPEGIEALRELYAPSPTPGHASVTSRPERARPRLQQEPKTGQPEAAEAPPEDTPPRRLLVSLGLRDHDDALVRYAGLISRVTEAEWVRFVHVFQMPSIVGRVYGRPQYHNPFTDAAAFLKEALVSLVDRRFGDPPHPAVQCDILEGTPLLELLRLAKEDDVDLLIAGRDRQGRTLTEKLARKAPCSVLVVPEDTPASLRRILVAVDFSAYTADAVRTAATLARAGGLDDLHILHVYDALNAARMLPGGLKKEQERLLAEEHFAASIQQLDVQGLRAVPHFVAGENVPHLIGAQAETLEADLVVVGTRGLSPSSIVLLGSVAEELVRWARVPVLAVKRKGATLSLLEAIFKM